jgi:hypothetical protein
MKAEIKKAISPLKSPRFEIGDMVAYIYSDGPTVIKRVEKVFLRQGIPGSSFDHWRVQIEGVEAPEGYFFAHLAE